MKSTSQKKNEARERRAYRVRARVIGSAKRPRLAVFRSAKHISAQLIDDASGKTLAAATDAKMKKAAVEGMEAKIAKAYAVGQALAESAKKRQPRGPVSKCACAIASSRPNAPSSMRT